MLPTRTAKRPADRTTEVPVKKPLRRTPSPSAPLSLGRPPSANPLPLTARKPAAAVRAPLLPKGSTLGSRSGTSRTTIASATDLRKRAKTPVERLNEEVASLKKDLVTSKEEKKALEEALQTQAEELRKRDLELEAMKKSEEILRKEVLLGDANLRRINNQLVDLKGQVRVAVRVRPHGVDEHEPHHLEYPSPSSILLKSEKAPSTFECTRVFPPAVTQSGVFKDISDFIQSAMDGYNVAIIAYGQTGSGKTHTMLGGDGEQKGIIPRAIEDMFAYQEKKRILNWEFTFRASYLEIHNEVCYDLLNKREKVVMRCSSTGATFENLSIVHIKTPSQILDLIYAAGSNRVTAKTACNAQSSRSHAIFQLHIDGKQHDEGTTFSSRLDLVDLAGSERAKESQVVGEQFKEMTCINQSLSTLLQCIRAARSKSNHVPYRDSKLTTALKSSIGGNSKTMMIVAINPSFGQIVESKRSLEFAQHLSSAKLGSATPLVK